MNKVSLLVSSPEQVQGFSPAVKYKLNNTSREARSSVSANVFKNKQDDKALQEACQGFEEVFLNTIMKSMRATIPDDPFMGKSQGMDIYTSLHDQYLAEKISQGENSTGIGEYLYRQLQDSVK